MRTNDFWQEARRLHFLLPRAPFLDRPASVLPVDFLSGLLRYSIFRQVLGGREEERLLREAHRGSSSRARGRRFRGRPILNPHDLPERPAFLRLCARQVRRLQPSRSSRARATPTPWKPGVSTARTSRSQDRDLGTPLSGNKGLHLV